MNSFPCHGLWLGISYKCLRVAELTCPPAGKCRLIDTGNKHIHSLSTQKVPLDLDLWKIPQLSALREEHEESKLSVVQPQVSI
jgi:hypothetical protein